MYLVGMNAPMKSTSRPNSRSDPSPDPELDDPRYLFGDAVAASGVSANTLKSWLSRKPEAVPLGVFDREALGKGSSRAFTLRRLISIAIAAELVRLGIQPSAAGAQAHTLTDTTIRRGKIGFLDDARFLAVYPDNRSVTLSEEGGPISDLFIFTRKVKRPASCAVLDIAAIIANVKDSLSKRRKANG